MKKKSEHSPEPMHIHPITQKQIPIWVANYILMDYGTGAIMAVPAHDQRDFEFAKAIQSANLRGCIFRKKQEKKAFEGEGTSHQLRMQLFHSMVWRQSEAKKKITKFLEEKKIGSQQVQYKLRDWLFSRQRYWGEPFPILHHQRWISVAVSEAELPVVLPPLERF
jgi:leucyl-tRNA synthetase